MLIQRVNNPFIKFKVLHANLKGGERVDLAKSAFLYVIANYDAYGFKKEEMLNCVVERCPEVISVLADEEMLKSFQFLFSYLRNRGKLVSTGELAWVKRYITDSATRIKIEKLVYQALLYASDYMDEFRRGFEWTILDAEKLELVREALRDRNLGFKRKIQLAKEFGEAESDFIRAYYKKLLWDRHYDKAEEIGVDYPDIIIEVIINNIDSGYFTDAIGIAKRFFPDRGDLITEIQSIADAT